MTHEEAKVLAKEVSEGKSRSYVQAAQALATFVLSLPAPPPKLDGEIIGTLEGPCKFVLLSEYEKLVANQQPPVCNACVSAGIYTCDHVSDGVAR